jgi:hypothetical protein
VTMPPDAITVESPSPARRARLSRGSQRGQWPWRFFYAADDPLLSRERGGTFVEGDLPPTFPGTPAGNDELCDSPWCKGSRPGGCGGRGSSGGRLLISAVTGFPAVTVTSSPWWRNAKVASELSRKP